MVIRLSKKIIASAILITLTAIFLFIPKQGIEVTVGHPQIGNIVETIPAYGKIRPVTEIKITPDVSGEIIELNIQEGDTVRQGDLIIQIRQDIYKSILEQAQATLNSVKAQYLREKANLRQMELLYNRHKYLYEKKAISKQEYEGAILNYEIAKSQAEAARHNIESAQASLKEAKDNLSKTNIHSPIDGIVSRLMVEKGERVVGTSQMAGTFMLSIASFDAMEVVVDVNENDIVKITKGDTAYLRLDSYPAEDFKGVVTQVASSAKNYDYQGDHISNYVVRIEILPSEYPLKPGMSASVKIKTDEKKNILILPLHSINNRGEVFVVQEGSSSVRAVRVLTGIQDIDNIEITAGLDTSSIVVLSPYEAINKTLTDNGKVYFD